MRAFRPALVVAALGILLAAGCDGSRSASAPPSSAALQAASGPARGSTLAPEQQPPSTVPRAVLTTRSGRQGGYLLATRWPDRRGSVVESTPREPVVWPAPVPVDGIPNITWRTSVVPARLEVRDFSSVDARSGVPEDQPRIFECRAQVDSGGGACAVQGNGADIEVSLPSTLRQYVVVYAEWFVPSRYRPSAARSVASWSASYGFHLDNH